MCIGQLQINGTKIKKVFIRLITGFTYFIDKIINEDSLFK